MKCPWPDPTPEEELLASIFAAGEACMDIRSRHWQLAQKTLTALAGHGKFIAGEGEAVWSLELRQLEVVGRDDEERLLFRLTTE